MNRTINISLNGMNFTLDESAYQMLEDYLNQLRDSLSHEDGKEEIMQDVEARIAELFKQDLGISRDVINEKDVEEMIQVMGRPEDYLEDENVGSENASTSTYKTGKDVPIHKKLFRDPDNKIIGGVLAGVSHYFGWDPTWIRIAYVAIPLIAIFLDAGSMAGFFTLTYIILWIVVPLAQTNLEKMEMYGEPKTVDNIKRSVSSSDLNSKLSEVGDFTKEVAQDARPYIERLFSALWRVFKVALGIFLLFNGIVLFTACFAALGATLFSNKEIFRFGSMIFDQSWQYYLASVLAFLCIFSLALILFYSGLRLVFSNKEFKNGTQVVLSSLGVFIVSSIALTIVLVNVGLNFRDDISYKNSVPIQTTSDTLQVQFKKENKGKLYFNSRGISGKIGANVSMDSVYYSTSKSIEMKKSDDDKYYLEIEYSSRGRTVEDARDNIEKIKYVYHVENNVLNLDPYFTMSTNDKFRKQSVKFTLYVPKNKWAKISNVEEVYNENDNFRVYVPHEPNQEVTLLMQQEDIKCLRCTDDQYSVDYDEHKDKDAYDYENKDVKVHANEDSVSIETPGVKMKIESK